jgi:hypothetical protein
MVKAITGERVGAALGDVAAVSASGETRRAGEGTGDVMVGSWEEKREGEKRRNVSREF